MKIIHKVKSNIDQTVRYVFDFNGQPVEFSYINKNDGKDIICVPTQTNCRLGCSFCFLTGRDAPVVNLSRTQIEDGIATVVSDVNLQNNGSPVLLVSMMGSGEPLNNAPTVLSLAWFLPQSSVSVHRRTRFAIASIIPSIMTARAFTDRVRDDKLDIKFHYSLHNPFDDQRKKLIPNGSPVRESLDVLQEYRSRTGNPVEIHYTLIAGVNDGDHHIAELQRLLTGRGIPVKFLAFKARPGDSLQPSERVDWFRKCLEHNKILTEFYDPPGSDIGAACGQFLQPEELTKIRNRNQVDHSA